MSHVVTIETEMKDPAAIAAACRRLGLAPPGEGEVEFYAGSARGTTVRLPGWRYPVVIDPGGAVHYDDFRGHWGDPGQLARLRQAYAVEKVRSEAARGRYRMRETTRADGSIHLTLTL